MRARGSHSILHRRAHAHFAAHHAHIHGTFLASWHTHALERCPAAEMRELAHEIRLDHLYLLNLLLYVHLHVLGLVHLGHLEAGLRCLLGLLLEVQLLELLRLGERLRLLRLQLLLLLSGLLRLLHLRLRDMLLLLPHSNLLRLFVNQLLVLPLHLVDHLVLVLLLHRHLRQLLVSHLLAHLLWRVELLKVCHQVGLELHVLVHVWRALGLSVGLEVLSCPLDLLVLHVVLRHIVHVGLRSTLLHRLLHIVLIDLLILVLQREPSGQSSLLIRLDAIQLLWLVLRAHVHLCELLLLFCLLLILLVEVHLEAYIIVHQHILLCHLLAFSIYGRLHELLRAWLAVVDRLLHLLFVELVAFLRPFLLRSRR